LEVLFFKSDAKVRLFFDSASVSAVFFRICIIFCKSMNFFGMKSVCHSERSEASMLYVTENTYIITINYNIRLWTE
jgi:hypothetical protein